VLSYSHRAIDAAPTPETAPKPKILTNPPAKGTSAAFTTPEGSMKEIVAR
jgi:hypothetical protein